VVNIPEDNIVDEIEYYRQNDQRQSKKDLPVHKTFHLYSFLSLQRQIANYRAIAAQQARRGTFFIA
jgi:hypothetical protein